MNRRKRIGSLGVMGLVLAALLLVGGALHAAEKDIYKTLDILSDVITIIQRDYIDKIGSEKLVHDALRGMLASLDSYSHYIPPPEPQVTPTSGVPAKDLGTYGVEV
ncbi:MAG: hypothetical protein P8123_01565, partial [bacterium]